MRVRFFPYSKYSARKSYELNHTNDKIQIISNPVVIYFVFAHWVFELEK